MLRAGGPTSTVNKSAGVHAAVHRDFITLPLLFMIDVAADSALDENKLYPGPALTALQEFPNEHFSNRPCTQPVSRVGRRNRLPRQPRRYPSTTAGNQRRL